LIRGGRKACINFPGRERLFIDWETRLFCLSRREGKKVQRSSREEEGKKGKKNFETDGLPTVFRRESAVKQSGFIVLGGGGEGGTVAEDAMRDGMGLGGKLLLSSKKTLV